MKLKWLGLTLVMAYGSLCAMDKEENTQRTIDFSQLNQEVEKSTADMDRLLVGVYSGYVCTQQEIDPSQKEPSTPMSSDSGADIFAFMPRTNNDIHELLGSLSIAPEEEETVRPRVRDRSPSLERNRSYSPTPFGKVSQADMSDCAQENSQEQLRRNHYQCKLDELHDSLRDLMKNSHFTPETKRNMLTDIRDAAKRYADLAQNFPGLYSRFGYLVCNADRQLNSLS